MPEREDLELHEQSSASEWGWTIRRIGWIAMLLLVIAAISGLFGAGPLDRARIQRNGFEVAYSRFSRMDSSAHLELTVAGAAADLIHVSIDRKYIQQFEINSITPEPESVSSFSDQVRYSFRTRAGQRCSVVFQMRANEGTFGRVAGWIGVEGIGETDFSQFIWP
jgi:hypothetical protein